ncbi:hypothetical protein MMC28_009137 [Mycoblastus sanguinarius]|nr:hypothetical protein [Mycoblastus sanguinarius]
MFEWSWVAIDVYEGDENHSSVKLNAALPMLNWIQAWAIDALELNWSLEILDADIGRLGGDDIAAQSATEEYSIQISKCLAHQVQANSMLSRPIDEPLKIGFSHTFHQGRLAPLVILPHHFRGRFERCYEWPCV